MCIVVYTQFECSINMFHFVSHTNSKRFPNPWIILLTIHVHGAIRKCQNKWLLSHREREHLYKKGYINECIGKRRIHHFINTTISC